MWLSKVFGVCYPSPSPLLGLAFPLPPQLASFSLRYLPLPLRLPVFSLHTQLLLYLTEPLGAERFSRSYCDLFLKHRSLQLFNFGSFLIPWLPREQIDMTKLSKGMKWILNKCIQVDWRLTALLYLFGSWNLFSYLGIRQWGCPCYFYGQIVPHEFMVITDKNADFKNKAPGQWV